MSPSVPFLQGDSLCRFSGRSASRTDGNILMPQGTPELPGLVAPRECCTGRESASDRGGAFSGLLPGGRLEVPAGSALARSCTLSLPPSQRTSPRSETKTHGITIFQLVPNGGELIAERQHP